MSDEPWYRRCRRLGQTNLVEVDPARFDLDHWRAQWARTRIDGVIVNCGGIVAYYPSEVEGHQRAPGIDERDLFGEIVAAAREDGLAVLARMDSNRGDQPLFDRHPDWFCVDRDGVPYRRGEKYATCVSTDYYDVFMPSIFREVIATYAPDGFADNGWAGIDRSRICYCEHCAKRFHAHAQRDLPLAVDWDDETFLAWVEWSYERRTELWENNNAVTRSAGGDHCLWLGMLHGQLAHNAAVFQDVAQLAKRTPVVLLDHQRRHGDEGFEQNAEVVRRIHGVLGWEHPVFECTAMYDMGYPAFRLSSMPRAEVELWMTQAWAGGARPWWHHIGSYHEDRRQYETSVGLFDWHARNDAVLDDRTPVANVGVVWSQRNLDLHGRQDSNNTVTAPYAGINRVLVTENIPFVPVHVDAIDEAEVDALVLPDLAVMTDEQCDAVRRFVARGGALVATGRTSLLDSDGRARPDLALADVFGAHVTGTTHGAVEPTTPSIEIWDRHSYLRLPPEGPDRHPVLAGLDGTETVSFGGHLLETRVTGDAVVPLTFVPPFPIFPPEISWMREPSTTIPALVLRHPPGSGRVAYLPADLDRCSFREEQPDHATILANCLRWAVGDGLAIEVGSAAPVATSLYRRRGGLVLHLNNLLYDSKVPGRQPRIVPCGPIDVRIRVGAQDDVGEVTSLVERGATTATSQGEWLALHVPSLGSHEVVTIELGGAA